jgi:hypothetical protein
MSKYEVLKTVEAVKLNQRTGLPLGEPPISLPYGAIIEKLEESGDFYKFTYLAQAYRMRRDNVSGALHPIEGVTVAPAEATAAGDVPASAPKPVLAFRTLPVSGTAALSRAKVPGGWLVAGGSGVAFVPDPSHEWDGTSLP